MAGPKRNYGEPPGDARAEGEVTFNYEAHDGRFLLGSEPWLFETSWSAGGTQAAHLYNDPPSIRGVAIAEGAATIDHIDPDVVARSDFTSRTRTPSIGQCVILENQNGYFAALQIVSLGYSDVPSKNMMTLRYAIRTDGSANFGEREEAAEGGAAVAARALLEAAEQARMALATVRGGETVTAQFGHNHPPAEFALSETERQEAIAAVEVAAVEAVQLSPDRARIRSAGEKIAKAARAIGLWIVGKTDLAIDEFSKTIGKAAAVAAVAGFAAWVAVHGKLSVLANLLSGFTG